jgi:hypothetical protein
MPQSKAEVLEVHGFDLLAQVEAMLRHVRQYQREVQRFRGLLGPGQTATSHKNRLTALLKYHDDMHRAYDSFGESLAEVGQVLQTLQQSGLSR